MESNSYEDPFSDNESTFSAELSPTDGYFSNREMPQHYYTADATIHSQESNPKVIEATQNTRNSGPGSTSNTSVPFRRRSSESVVSPSESTPLLLQSELAPPPYTDDDARRNQSSNGQSIQLPLFNTSRDPESMGGDSSDPYDQSSYAASRRWNWSDRLPLRRILIRAACIFGTILVLFILFIKIISSPSKQSQHHGITSENGCSRLSTSAVEMSFDELSSFAFSEEINSNLFYADVTGSVKLAKAPFHQAEQLKIVITLADDLSDILPPLQACKADESVTINVEQNPDDINFKRHRGTGPGERVTINAIIYAKEGLELNDLALHTIRLHHVYQNDLSLSIDETTDITSIIGTISLDTSLRLDSRKTIISGGTGSISGDFWLKDELTLKTTTGSINVRVNPMKASDKVPKRAVFSASSTTGSIDIAFPIDSAPINTPSQFREGYLPERDYDISVTSTTGSVNGKYVIGSSTRIDSRGSIDADLKPYDASQRSVLTTRTTTGSTGVRVLSAYKDSSKSLKSLKSTHESLTGSLSLTYPHAWEGHIYGTTTTGSISISGPGVKVIKQTGMIAEVREKLMALLYSENREELVSLLDSKLQEKIRSLIHWLGLSPDRMLEVEPDSYFGHGIEAEKGDGDSTLNFKDTTGSANIVFLSS